MTACVLAKEARRTEGLSEALVRFFDLPFAATGNETWHPRPTLILRYDYKETPPPGDYTSTDAICFVYLLHWLLLLFCA